MKTAEEMFQFYFRTLSEGRIDKYLLKSFKLIEQNLDENEEALIAFKASLNYESILKNDGFYSFAITNKRIILAQDLWIDKKIKIFDLDEINDVKVHTSIDDNPKVILSTPTEEVQICFMLRGEDNLAKEVQNVIFRLKK